MFGGTVKVPLAAKIKNFPLLKTSRPLLLTSVTLVVVLLG
jgi:hypothetical protein